MSAPSDILKGYVFIVFEVSDYKMSLLNDKSIGVQWFISHPLVSTVYHR